MNSWVSPKLCCDFSSFFIASFMDSYSIIKTTFYDVFSGVLDPSFDAPHEIFLLYVGSRW